jgi:copper chaperone CopZ
MEQHFEITGMHCGGCVKRVTLEPPQAVLQVDAPLAPETVQAALSAIGEFQARPLTA